MSEVVKVEQDGAVRCLILNRPDALNAMNRPLIDAVADAFDEANRDADTRAIVFTGAGRAFCAGDDLKTHRHPDSAAAARDLVDAIQRVTRAIVFGDKPVVGAINGWAVGGGFEWAINCDFPIWAQSARGFFPEVEWGLFVTGAVTALLPRLVGMNRAREMLLLGMKYDAATLFDYGVAWRVVPDAKLVSEAMAVAQTLAGLPARAVTDMKRALRHSAYGGADALEGALAVETEATVAAFLDPATTRRIEGFGRR